MNLTVSTSHAPPRFASVKPKPEGNLPYEGFKGFSNENDPVLPEPTLWQKTRKGVLIGGMAVATVLGGFWMSAWQRDPVSIYGRFNNPRHMNKPDITVSRVYTLPESKIPILLDLTLFAEPTEKNRPTPFEMMIPEAFVKGVRQIVRWEHYSEIRPQMEALMAQAEKRFGPRFTTDQLKTMLREPWTDAQGNAHDVMWRKPIAHTTIEGIPCTLSLENIEVDP